MSRSKDARTSSSQPTKSTVPARWPHQQETLSFFRDVPRGFDFSSPGTGKTRGQIDSYLESRSNKRMLIVAPKTLMASAWGADIEKFAPELTVSFAYAENREEAFKLMTDVVIINTDGVKWLHDKGKKYLKDFSHLVIDESNTYKHRTSQRSKAMAKLRRNFEYRRLLSGTPNPNSVTELWHPALIVDDGARLGTSFFNFRNSVQTPTQVGPSANHIRWDDKPGAVQAVTELLSDITIRHEFEDVMAGVPANHRDVKQFALKPRTKKLYDQLERDCILTLETEVVSAVHAASLRTKLLQLASGATYTEDGRYVVVDRQRYELVGDLVDDRKHSVVFFNWKHQRDELAKEFDKRGFSFAIIDGDTPPKERNRIVDDYQEGHYRTILMHPRTGAHGLTLTRGTTTILSSPIYESDLLQQAIHRIYRGGQTQVTNTILVQAKDTVESAVYERLNSKHGQMMDLLDLIRRRRQ